MLKPGTLLSNRYRIRDILGRGGMGAVYLAEAEALGGKKVAVKEMIPWGLPPEELGQAVAQFKREAAFLANLEHPNLVRVTDFFVQDQKHYLVMAYIQGTTLQESLARRGKPFHWYQLSAWVDRLLDVLDYLHSQDPPILFRDLKPSNIMVCEDGRLHLIDFGIARVATSGQKTTTFLQGTGTRGFSPIEQYGDQMSTDQRSDIYALGATLYYLMTATLPPDAVERVARRKKIVPLTQKEPGLPSGLDEILLKCMAISADDRYQNIAEVRTALLSLDPPTELHLSKDASAVPLTTRADLTRSFVQPTRQAGRAWRGWLSAAGCLLLTGGIFLGVGSEVSAKDLAVKGRASDSIAVAFGPVVPETEQPGVESEKPVEEVVAPPSRRVVAEASEIDTEPRSGVAVPPVSKARAVEARLALDSYPKAAPRSSGNANLRSSHVAAPEKEESIPVTGSPELPISAATTIVSPTTTTTEQTGPTQPVQAPIYVMPPESISGFGYDGSSSTSASSTVYETNTQWASRGQTVDPTQSVPAGGPSLTNLAGAPVSPPAGQPLGNNEPVAVVNSQSEQKAGKGQGGGDKGGNKSGSSHGSKTGKTSGQSVALNGSSGGGQKAGGKQGQKHDGGGGGKQKAAPPPPPPPSGGDGGGGKKH